jgi:hypothetical protein
MARSVNGRMVKNCKASARKGPYINLRSYIFGGPDEINERTQSR